mmetsp:Transcript_24382/g.58408  ORF Transcript_24382/g.58408 Transcript_24382/m.58408 type:complete len:227 (+) Transcript_24382:429-1109(+)
MPWTRPWPSCTRRTASSSAYSRPSTPRRLSGRRERPRRCGCRQRLGWPSSRSSVLARWCGHSSKRDSTTSRRAPRRSRRSTRRPAPRCSSSATSRRTSCGRDSRRRRGASVRPSAHASPWSKSSCDLSRPSSSTTSTSPRQHGTPWAATPTRRWPRRSSGSQPSSRPPAPNPRPPLGSPSPAGRRHRRGRRAACSPRSRPRQRPSRGTRPVDWGHPAGRLTHPRDD